MKDPFPPSTLDSPTSVAVKTYEFTVLRLDPRVIFWRQLEAWAAGGRQSRVGGGQGSVIVMFCAGLSAAACLGYGVAGSSGNARGGAAGAVQFAVITPELPDIVDQLSTEAGQDAAGEHKGLHGDVCVYNTLSSALCG